MPIHRLTFDLIRSLRLEVREEAMAMAPSFSMRYQFLRVRNHYQPHNYTSIQTSTIVTPLAFPATSNVINPTLTWSDATSTTILTQSQLHHPLPASILLTGGGDGTTRYGGDEVWEDGDAGDRNKNRQESMSALAEAGRSLETLPADLAAAIEEGRVPGLTVERFFELEKSLIYRWLLNFGGFKERLLADDLFLAKIAMECGIGILTKTVAELEGRKENFTKELDFVLADVVMAIIADFMLVWLPAPTVSLQQTLTIGDGPISNFFIGCPDNAFQVALAGTSYSVLQRLSAIVINGVKLFAVGTGASLVGTAITNGLINAKKVVDKSFALETEDIPILSTSIAYGVYMAVSCNLRYQVLAGIIEQRMLEPTLHEHKLILSAFCFAVRTGNTFLGSLMWVDYARWVGVQKIRD